MHAIKKHSSFFGSSNQLGSVNHQMAVPVPNISCCVFSNYDFFYQELNELAFNWDTCCHLVICLQLIASHYKELLNQNIIFTNNFQTDGKKGKKEKIIQF
jgi:hypothetical protein